MDVDVAAVGVDIPAFFAFEPEDAGDDRVATGGVDGDDFAGGAAAFSAGRWLCREATRPPRAVVAPDFSR